ncbi:hypothetical protein [Paraburkholderia rhynchosiae]|uniref:hypothetical protein n=1 Tax=Paraburkholderia rhynchosiae TaxID=487049 RepID=UPI001304C9CA|nr:hypothetical protein [Paraburkholderia rhynchosiae]
MAKDFYQQAEHANQNGDARAQQHEREKKNKRRFQTVGCRHDECVWLRASTTVRASAVHSLSVSLDIRWKPGVRLAAQPRRSWIVASRIKSSSMLSNPDARIAFATPVNPPDSPYEE